MLLLAIAFDKFNYSLKEKVALFMEVYGNSSMRYASITHLDSILNTLISAITDPDYMEKRFPIFDISKLRQKDIDALENIFVFWRTKKAKEINIEELWNQ